MDLTPNKSAVKVALAVSLSVCCALWLQWDKPYWSGMAVIVIAMSESLGHAIKKGQHRLIGTSVGIVIGLLLISFLSQERFLFLASLCAVLVVCVFMTSDEEYGDIYLTVFISCVVVASIGGFDSQITFNTLLLRLQETLLGVVAYTLVFRVLWPWDTEEIFFLLFSQTQQKLITSLDDLGHFLATEPDEGLLKKAIKKSDHRNSIKKLNEYLNVPLKGSYQLQNQHRQWKIRVKAMSVAQYYLSFILQNISSSTPLMIQQRRLNKAVNFLKDAENDTQPATISTEYILQAYDNLPSDAKPEFMRPRNYRLDALKALKALSIFVTAIFMWIYLPIPDSYLFPLNAAIYAGLLATMPDRVFKHWMLGYLRFAILFIAQYVLIMPLMTEVWQLALFYFINTFIIWRVASKPQFVIHRLIGGNLMMMMTMGALHSTPTFDIETSLIMLIYIMLSLVLVQFYTRLFSNKIAQLGN